VTPISLIFEKHPHYIIKGNVRTVDHQTAFYIAFKSPLLDIAPRRCKSRDGGVEDEGMSVVIDLKACRKGRSAGIVISLVDDVRAQQRQGRMCKHTSKRANDLHNETAMAG